MEDLQDVINDWSVANKIADLSLCIGSQTVVAVRLYPQPQARISQGIKVRYFPSHPKTSVSTNFISPEEICASLSNRTLETKCQS